jgi:TonB family protein
MNLFAQIVRAAFWFHPVVWALVSRLSREQELTCDEAVVASGHSRHDYAAFLLDAVRNLKSGEMFACSMAGSGGRSLKQRFAYLLDPIPRPAPIKRIALTLALLALVATTLAVVRPVWSQSEDKNEGDVYRVGNDVLQPIVLTKIEPKYTEEARTAKISGPVHVSLVVTAEGNPDSIEVTDGIGYGLDESAIEAISQWTFQPATKDGKAVAVRANVLVNFRLL